MGVKNRGLDDDQRRSARAVIAALPPHHVNNWPVRSPPELYKAQPDIIDSLPLWPFGLDQV